MRRRAFLVVELLEARVVLDGTVGPLPMADLSTDVNEYASEHVLVQFAPGVDAASVLPAGANLGDALSLVDGLHIVTVPDGWSVPQTISAFQSSPDVLWVQPDYRVFVNLVPNDPSFGVLWGLHNTGQSGGMVGADIGAVEAWNVGTGTGSIIVAVIDTGIDYNHPDIKANMWVNPGEVGGNGQDDDGNGYVDDIHGWNFVAGTNDPMDDNGHGTHVAGTIGAVGDNGVGVTGVIWNVQLMALKFLNSSGSGSTSNAIRALNYAVTMGAHISNNSWGGGGYNQSLLDAIKSAQSKGHIFVAAAGNNGSDNDVTPFYPSSYNLDNVVAVAATDRYDKLASFSNYGATSVDIAAPGVSIYSTIHGGSYGYKSGTSMAAPHVAGALALVWDLNPDWTYQQVIQQVFNTVDPLSSLTGKMTTGGRLNLGAALQGSTQPPPSEPTEPPPSESEPAPELTAPAAPADLSASVKSKPAVRVTLAWSDNSNNEEGFRVERSTDGTNWVLLGQVGANVVSFEDSTVATGETYSYRVLAFNAQGESAWSNETSVLVGTKSNNGGGGNGNGGGKGNTKGMDVAGSAFFDDVVLSEISASAKRFAFAAAPSVAALDAAFALTAAPFSAPPLFGPLVLPEPPAELPSATPLAKAPELVRLQSSSDESERDETDLPGENPEETGTPWADALDES